MNTLTSIARGEDNGETTEITVGCMGGNRTYTVFRRDVASMGIGVEKVAVNPTTLKAHEKERDELANGLKVQEDEGLPESAEEYVNSIIQPLWNIANHIKKLGFFSIGRKDAIARNYTYIHPTGMPHIFDEKTYRIGIILKLLLHTLHETDVGPATGAVIEEVLKKLPVLDERLAQYEAHRHKLLSTPATVDAASSIVTFFTDVTGATSGGGQQPSP